MKLNFSCGRYVSKLPKVSKEECKDAIDDILYAVRNMVHEAIDIDQESDSPFDMILTAVDVIQDEMTNPIPMSKEIH